jgi:hypothetical protein
MYRFCHSQSAVPFAVLEQAASRSRANLLCSIGCVRVRGT